MNNLLKQAQKLQEDMEETQKWLESEEIEVSDSTGAFRVTITASTQIKAVYVGEDLVLQGKEAIEAAGLEAFQKSIDAARKKHEEAMKKITEGLNFQGLLGGEGG